MSTDTSNSDFQPAVRDLRSKFEQLASTTSTPSKRADVGPQDLLSPIQQRPRATSMQIDNAEGLKGEHQLKESTSNSDLKRRQPPPPSSTSKSQSPCSYGSSRAVFETSACEYLISTSWSGRYCATQIVFGLEETSTSTHKSEQYLGS